MVHHGQPSHQEVLLRAHIRVNFVCLVVSVVEASLGNLELLHCRTATPAGLTVELPVKVQLDVGCLQSVLFEQLALILRELFRD